MLCGTSNNCHNPHNRMHPLRLRTRDADWLQGMLPAACASTPAMGHHFKFQDSDEHHVLVLLPLLVRVLLLAPPQPLLLLCCCRCRCHSGSGSGFAVLPRKRTTNPLPSEVAFPQRALISGQ